MRTSDPDSYEDFSELTTATTFNNTFRGILLVAGTSAAVRATVEITKKRVVNGVSTSITKTIYMVAPTAGSMFLPISGDSVKATFSTGNMFVFI